MKLYLKILLVSFVFSNCNGLNAQESSEVLYSINIGYTAEIFSAPSLPFTISADLRKRYNNVTALVTGVAFHYTDNDRVNGFLSRSEVKVYFTHVFGGVRFYFTKPTNNFQFFSGINLGSGVVYKKEGEFSSEASGYALLADLNLNLGFILKDRFIISPSVDIALNTQQVGYIFSNFKVGYQF